METEKNILAGMGRREARLAAKRAFGTTGKPREESRRRRSVPVVEPLYRDLRLAIRSLVKNRAFSVVAVLTIALGIGATTAVFSVTNALLFRPLPVPEADRLVTVQEQRWGRMSRGLVGMKVPYTRYKAYEEATRDVFDGLAAHRFGTFALRLPQRTLPVMGTEVTGNYFRVLGIRPELGRLIESAYTEEVVLSHSFWQTQFDLDPDVLGQTVRLDGRPFTVVGVAASYFRGTSLEAPNDLWVPLGAGFAEDDPEGASAWVGLIGRLRQGVARRTAQALVKTVALRVPPDEPQTTFRGARVESVTGFRGGGRSEVEESMALLLALSLLVVLIASSNMSSMLLAKSYWRRREYAVRMAIGAGRFQVIRQILAESLLLALVGGGAGVGLAYIGTDWLAGRPLPMVHQIGFDLSPDPSVLFFSFFVTTLAGLVFGLAPAIHASGSDVVQGLKDGGSSGGTRASRWRRYFVGGQVTMAVLLMLVATLFTRSLQRGLKLDVGFDPSGVVVSTVNLGALGYEEHRSKFFYAQLLENVRQLPGVESAGTSEFIILGGARSANDISTPDPSPDGLTRIPGVRLSWVDPGFFDTMRMDVVAGRGVTSGDENGSQPVVVVNEALASSFWPGQTPLGRRLEFHGEEREIVGVVSDGRFSSVTEAPRPFVFIPFAQGHTTRMIVHARAPVAESQTLRGIEEEVRKLEPNAAVSDAATLSDVLDFSLIPHRFGAGFVGLFGSLGLLLAALGLHGIMSFQVAQRTRELGVRRALGAHTVDVMGLVFRSGGRIVAIGCGIGLVLGVLVALGLRGFLFGLSPVDPPTFLGVPLLLGLVALVSGSIPALRAASVDPMEALRQE
jgi:predicted permease